MGVVQRTLQEAILRELRAEPADAKGLARRLRADGHPGCDRSSVNRALYELARDHRVRRVGSSPPLWAVNRAGSDRGSGRSAPKERTQKTGAKTAKSKPGAGALRAKGGKKAKAKATDQSGPPGSVTRKVKTAGRGPASQEPSAGEVWAAAVKHLAKGRPLHRNTLVSLIRHDTGFGDRAIIEGLNAGFAGAIHEGVYFDLRPEHRLVLTLKALLPDLTTTPAGHLRSGSIRLEAAGRAGAITARFEVVDDELCYWFCCRASDPASWAALHRGAETVSSDWTLPLRPADAGQPLPAPLLWRSADLAEAIAAACQVTATLRVTGFDKVTLTPLPNPLGPITLQSTDQQTIARITRRRGIIPAGRRYPIAGNCDRCNRPLSDPYSLLVGVGPICRGYYSPHVLAAIARTRGPISGPSGPTTRARTPADALARLAKDWA